MQLKAIVEAVSKDKNLKKEVVVSAISRALENSMKKQYPYGRLESSVDSEMNFKMYHFKTVVESEPEMLDEASEVTIQEARKMDKEVELGDEVGFEVEMDLGRIQANIAKQAIAEVIKAEESKKAYDLFKDLKGKIVSGVVQNSDKRGVLVTLGAVDAFVPRAELMPRDFLKRNQTCEFVLKDISFNDKGQLNLSLSRVSNKFVIQALKEEVPEIELGEIEVVACVREPGHKTKIVVDSEVMNNPASICIGNQGNRIQKVTHRVGERVDVISYSDEITKFLSGLLSGVKVRHVKEENGEYHGEVLKEDFARAIGKDGVNVRLAAKILGKKVVIV